MQATDYVEGIFSGRWTWPKDPVSAEGNALRLALLADTLAFAKRRCRAYKAYPDDGARALSAWRELPVISRDDLAAAPGDYVTLDPYGHFDLTSGTSTGRSLYIARSKAERRFMRGVRQGTTAVNELPIVLRLLPCGRLIPGGAGQQNELLFVFANNMARENLWDNWDTAIGQLFSGIERQGRSEPIKVVHGTPPYALLLLSRYMLRRGLDPRETAVRHLLGTGSHLGAHRRAWLCEVWNADFLTTYSCAEFNHTAWACNAHHRHYHFDYTTFVEVLDRSGEQVECGEAGRVVLTGNYPFHQGTMLLRYDIGDLAEWRGVTSCECGRGGPTLKLLGRGKDCISFTDGSGHEHLISSLDVIDGLSGFDCVPDVPRQQFRLKASNSMGPRELELDVEVFALAGRDWQVQKAESIRGAVLRCVPRLAEAVGAGTANLLVRLHPRGALSVDLRAR